MGLLAVMAALTLIWYLVTRGFALAWEHLPWLVIAWGLSGIALLTLAFIYSARILYYAGGWDLGISQQYGSARVS